MNAPRAKGATSQAAAELDESLAESGVDQGGEENQRREDHRASCTPTWAVEIRETRTEAARRYLCL
jgi:hypothetical protein